MKVDLGDTQRSFVGAWVLAALLVLGHNGFNLMSLIDQPLLGYPQEVKGIRQQSKVLEQLRSLAVREAKAVAEVDLDQVFARFEPLLHMDAWGPSCSPGHAEAEKEQDRGPDVPRLAGILWVWDGEGRPSSVAVINGRRCREKDEVEGFTVKKITEQGVILTRWGAEWFLPAPQGRFSVVRKDPG